MDSHFYYVERLLNNRQKSDSFDAHIEENFKSTTSLKYLRKCSMFKVFNEINPIRAMK